MVKFMQSVGDKMLELLEAEARRRDLTVQKLVRAIIIPDWFDRHTISRTISQPFSLPISTTSPSQRAKPTRSSGPSTIRELGLADESWT